MSYCGWDRNKEQQNYHNKIWGRPVHSDSQHFEFLLFEVLQCGLSWWLVYGKRNIVSECFNHFDYYSVSRFDDSDVERIINTKGMIKSEKKIRAIIHNAKLFIEIIKEYGSFDKYLWKYTNNKSVVYDKHPEGFIPVSNGLSKKISDDLFNRGFKYTGPIVIYSHLQACGIILDHDKNCPCFNEIISKYPTIYKKRNREVGVKKY